MFSAEPVQMFRFLKAASLDVHKAESDPYCIFSTAVNRSSEISCETVGELKEGKRLSCQDLICEVYMASAVRC